MRLGHVVRKYRLMTELTLRGLASEIGIAASSLMRLDQGHMPDSATLGKVLTWLMKRIDAPEADGVAAE